MKKNEDNLFSEGEKKKWLELISGNKKYPKLHWDNSKTPFENISKIMKRNDKKTDKKFSSIKSIIEKIFDRENKIMNYYVPVQNPLIRANIEGWASLLSFAYQSNLTSIYFAYDLTNKGAYNTAAPLLRQVYEFLILSKYCALTNNYQLYNRWGNGEEIKLYTEIFQKLDEKVKDSLYPFFKEMCKSTHSTIYAQQPFDLWDEEMVAVENNYGIILFLLEMNYHLLNSYFVNSSINHYVRMYADPDNIGYGDEKTKPLKKELKKLFGISHSILNKNSKKIIYNYKLKWKIKSI